MTILNTTELHNKSDFAIAFIDDENNIQFITIQEGSGDNLDENDTSAGYIDYINYATYAVNDDHILTELDGGIEMLTTAYSDLTENEIIEIIVFSVTASLNGRAIILPKTANTEFFEDACDQDINEDDIIGIYDGITDTISKYI